MSDPSCELLGCPERLQQHFAGRTHELREIAAFVLGNQSISLVGPRQIGKTALILRLMHPPTWPELGLGPDNLFVYLNCRVLGEGAHAELFGRLATRMMEVLAERGLAPEPALAAAVAQPGRIALDTALRRLDQRDLRVVWLLDDFERLSANTQLDISFFTALRSLAARHRLVFVTASTRPLIELTYADHAQEIVSSPFFNIFASIFLGLLPEDEARALIRGAARGAGSSCSPAAQAFIYNLAGGHPFQLQVACAHTLAVLASASGGYDEIERRTGDALAAFFSDQWHGLTPAERSLVRQPGLALSEIADDPGRSIVLRDLVRKCLLVADGGSYRSPSRAWARFLAYHQCSGE